MNAPDNPLDSASENPLVQTQHSNLLSQSAYMPPSPVWLDAGSEDEGLNWMGLLHSFRRRWLPGTLIGLVIGGIVGALMFLMIPENYEARALLRVRMSQNDLLDAGKRNYASQQEYAVYKQTQAALMASPYVLNAAIRSPEIQSLGIISTEDHPVAYLEEELRVEYPGDSEILRVTLAAANDKEAIQVVNAVVKAYSEEIAQSERNDLTRRLELLRSTHRNNVRESQQLNETIEKLAADIGTPDSAAAMVNQNIAESELKYLERQKMDLESDFMNAQSRLYELTMVRQTRNVSPTKFEIEDQLEKDPEYFELSRQLKEVNRYIAQVSGVARRGGGEIAQLQTQASMLNQELDKRRRALTPRIKARILADKTNEDEELGNMAALRAQVQTTGQRLKDIGDRYTAQLEKVRQLTGFSAELVTKKNNLESLQESNDEISQEIQRLELNLKTPPRVELIQNAMIPDHSSKIMKLLAVAASAVGTFLLSLVGVAAWDYASQRLNGSKELNAIPGLRVLGSMPSLRRSSLLGGAAKESVVADSIDSIRSAIKYGSSSQAPINSVIVTSALSNEGKTTVASQLAVSLARGGQRTLLIDGDIRNPQQHAVFGLPAERGLCDVLRGEAKLEEVVQATPAENLWILPAGRCDVLSYQALSGQTVPVIMQRLTEQFDFTVVDSGCVLTGPESLIFGQHVGGAVLSTRRDISRLPKVEEANVRLKSVGVSVIGTVVNGGGADTRSQQLTISQS